MLAHFHVFNSTVGTGHAPDRAHTEIRSIERDGSSPAFGLGGDSGSLVIDRASRRAVGLYFAGPDNGVYGLACHISDVLEELGIELIV